MPGCSALFLSSRSFRNGALARQNSRSCWMPSTSTSRLPGQPTLDFKFAEVIEVPYHKSLINPHVCFRAWCGRVSCALEGLAIRSDLPGGIELEMCVVKVQKLWSGLRKRWASCGDASKEPELQALKDKMRPCYDQERAEILSGGPWQGSEGSPGEDSQALTDVQDAVVLAEPESQFDGPSDSESHSDGVESPKKLADAACSSSPRRDLDVLMAQKNAKLLGMAGVNIFRQKSAENVDEAALEPSSDGDTCPHLLRSPVESDVDDMDEPMACGLSRE